MRETEGEIAVKVCGITNVDDALACCAAGASVIGLNFAMGPRRISIGKGVTIARAVSGVARTAGVFVDADPADVRRIADGCQLDYVQLHGREDREYIDQLKGLRIIKAFRPETGIRMESFEQPGVSEPHRSSGFLDGFLETALLPNVEYLLIDAHAPGQYGGTGLQADWSVAAALGSAMTRQGLRKPGDAFTGLAIAGGLGPDNVRRCIEAVDPDMVDLNSCVESSPGKKNAEKVSLTVIEVLRARRVVREGIDEVEL